MNPLLSIVIANYNYGRYLAEAIESVISQSCTDYELIIVDGGSTDGSVDVIKKYESKLAWWVSEPDGGQSNAFNKGFAHARGRFLTWLNADDVFLPGAIDSLRRASEKYPNCKWFVGGVLWLDPEMKIINCGRGRKFSEVRYRSGFVNGCGPSTFFSRKLYDSAGGVDERFNLMMDSDLWLRFAKLGFRYRPCCDYAWGLRLHPGAKMSNHNFDENGNLDLSNKVSSNDDCLKHQCMIEEETALMLHGFHAEKLTKMRRLLSVSWRQVVLARFDLCKWRGKQYKEIFK